MKLAVIDVDGSVEQAKMIRLRELFSEHHFRLSAVPQRAVRSSALLINSLLDFPQINRPLLLLLELNRIGIFIAVGDLVTGKF